MSPSIMFSVNSERSRPREVDALDLGDGEAAAIAPAAAELLAALLLQDAPELRAEGAPDLLAADADAEEGLLRAALAEIVGVAVMAFARQLALRGAAPREPFQQPVVPAAVGEPEQPDGAGPARALEEAHVVAVELLAAELDRHVETRGGLDEPGVGPRSHGLAAGPDAVAHATAGAAVPGVVEFGAACRRACRKQARPRDARRLADRPRSASRARPPDRPR